MLFFKPGHLPFPNGRSWIYYILSVRFVSAFCLCVLSLRFVCAFCLCVLSVRGLRVGTLWEHGGVVSR